MNTLTGADFSVTNNRLCNAKDLGEVYCLPQLMSVYDFNNPEGVTNVYNKDFKK